MFTDTHCHLYSEFFDNIDEVLKRAKDNNIYRVISCADSISSCQEVHYESYKHDNYYYALGIHPENSHESYKELEHFVYYCIPNPRFVAIGEIGLDYHYESFNKEEQIDLLDKQLTLAEKVDLPVIVHSREATKDTIDILKKHNCRGVIHCFSGSLETAREYIKMGYYIGVGGVSTFKNAKIKDVIKELPLDRIILETDSPFLAPVPHRGEKNEPAYVSDIASFIADLFGITRDQLSMIIEDNVNTLFGFKD